MIQIQYEGYDSTIQTAVSNVNVLLQSSDFYEAIRRHKRFDLANVPPAWIADLLEASDITMHIDFYFSIHPFSKSMTVDNPKNPTIIYLNRWSLGRSLDGLCNALVHQCIHAVNANFQQYSFGHGNNSTEGKENTAPYWIADLAQKMITKGHSFSETGRDEEICDYSSTASILLQVKLQSSTLFQTYH